jgi:thymidylate synthase (FAD)
MLVRWVRIEWGGAPQRSSWSVVKVGVLGVNQMPIRVHVVGRPGFDARAFLAFLTDAGTTWRRTPGARPPEELVEAAGRVCYMSFGGAQSARDNGDYVGALVRMGHESVLEHVNWSFVVCGVTRSLSHQLVRHRVGFAFSQLSQQYHDESDAACIMPRGLDAHPRAAGAWRRSVAVAKEAYREILEVLEQSQATPGPVDDKRELRRFIRSAARSVLPSCTETTVFATANARALRHFFAVRGKIPGDPEMRELAAQLLEAVRKEAPSLFSDFEVGALEDGSPEVRRAEARFQKA